MNNIAKLIKSKTISFNEMLIRYYHTLGLNETEAMILMVLYVEEDELCDVLSVEELKSKVSLNETELSETLLKLVQKGFIELLIDGNGHETFNLEPAIEKLGERVSTGDDKATNSKEDLIHEIVGYIENCYQKVLNPSDLMIINNWIDLNYTLNEMKQAILDSLKAKKMHIKYADAILANRKKERKQEVEVDDDIKQLLQSVYVGRR